MAGGSISTVERSISTIGGPGRGISTIGRSISIKAYPPGRGISTVGRSVSIGAYPSYEVLAGAYPPLEGAYPWEHIHHRRSW